MLVSINYTPNPEARFYPEGEPVLFGTYRLEFDDHFAVLLPHTGYRGTVSEDRLDIEDPEIQRHLMAAAEGIKEGLAK